MSGVRWGGGRVHSKSSCSSLEDAKPLSHHSRVARTEPWLLVTDRHCNLETRLVENGGKCLRSHSTGLFLCSAHLRQDLGNVRLQVRNERTVAACLDTTCWLENPATHFSPLSNSQETPLDFLLDEATLFWSRKHNRALGMLDVKYCTVLPDWSKDTRLNILSLLEGLFVRVLICS